MLLGREREQRALEELLSCARLGRSGVLVLEGEAGIGKTALIEDCAERATGLSVLRARGIEAETRVPFAGLYELLRPALALISRIPPPMAAALETAFAFRPAAAGERFAVGAATLSLLAAYAEEKPTLILIDDAHLLDASSTEALRFALRRLLAEPIAVVLAVREGESSLIDETDLPRLRLSGLDRAAAAGLLGTLPDATADRLYTATGGNPLALLELARESARAAAPVLDAPLPLPAKLSRSFLRRAEALDARTRRMLVLASIDDGDDLPTLERAGGFVGLALGDLAPAEDAGLLRSEGDTVVFRHPLARTAILGGAPPAQRREAHRAIARALPDRDVDRRAWHLAAAVVGTDDVASSALEQAGARSRQRGAYAIAGAAFERAAQIAPDDTRRGRLLTAAAEAMWLAGIADHAVSLLVRARALVTDTAHVVEIERLRGHIAVRRGSVIEGRRILLAAAKEVAEADRDVAIAVLAEAVEACFLSGDARIMARTARRLAELRPRGASTRTRFLADMATGMAHVFAGDAQSGIRAIQAAVALAEEHRELRADPSLLSWLVMGPLWIRDASAGRELVDEAIDTARRQAALGILPWLLGLVARDHAAANRWDAATVEYDEATRLAREAGQRTELAAALAGLAWLEAHMGREDDCRAHSAEAETVCSELGIGLFEIWAIRARGELELGLGRPAAAIEPLEECEQLLRRLGVHDVDVSPAAELVEAYLRVGRTADAAAAADRLERAAKRKGQPWSLARAARCRGMLAPDGEFTAWFEKALALHEQTLDAFELAVTRLAHGERLRRSRQRIRARVELRAAIAIFDRLGAAPWTELARTELLASGETARSRDHSAIDSLTRQELHIAQLLSSGQTTREAAAGLFLSPKTVEYHLRNVYRKLDVNSRSELAAALEPMSS